MTFIYFLRQLTTKVNMSYMFNILLLLTCVGMFVYQSVIIVSTYVSRPYGSKVDTIDSFDGVPLPNIRLCPSSWINNQVRTQMNISNQLLEYFLGSFADPVLPQSNYSTSDLAGFEIEAKAFQMQHGFSDDYYPHQLFDLLKISCSKTFIMCEIEGKAFDCCRSDHIKVTYEGLGLCYIFFPNAWRQQLRGVGNGMNIQMIHEPSLRIPDEVFNRIIGNGILTFSSAVFNPFIENPVFVPLNSKAFISFQATKLIRIANCRTTLVKPKLLFDDCRTGSACCIYDCVLQMAADECNCVHFAHNISAPVGLNYCTPLQFNTCYRDFIRHLGAKYELCRNLNRNTCKMECVENVYDTANSVASINIDIDRFLHLKQETNISVVELSFFMERIRVQEIVQFATATPESLISSLGGLLGLWLGLSVFGTSQLIFTFFKRWKMTTNTITDTSSTKQTANESYANYIS